MSNGLSRKLPENLAGTTPLCMGTNYPSQMALLLSSLLSQLLMVSALLHISTTLAQRRIHLCPWHKRCAFRKNCAPSANHTASRHSCFLDVLFPAGQDTPFSRHQGPSTLVCCSSLFSTFPIESTDRVSKLYQCLAEGCRETAPLFARLYPLKQVIHKNRKTWTWRDGSVI